MPPSTTIQHQTATASALATGWTPYTIDAMTAEGAAADIETRVALWFERHRPNIPHDVRGRAARMIAEDYGQPGANATLTAEHLDGYLTTANAVLATEARERALRQRDTWLGLGDTGDPADTATARRPAGPDAPDPDVVRAAARVAHNPTAFGPMAQREALSVLAAWAVATLPVEPEETPS